MFRKHFFLLVHLTHPSILKSPPYSVAKHTRLAKVKDTLTDERRTLEYSAEPPTKIGTSRKTSH